MGCGQSKKIHLYPRKNKSKSNAKKGHEDGGEDDEEEHPEEKDEHHHKEKDKIDEDLHFSDGGSPEPNSNEVIIPILKKNGPLLQSQDISSSQQNFFRLLDQKIEQGADYDSGSETEMALEEARLNTLVQHWESASITTSMCSSTSRSLQNTPVRQASLKQQQIRPQFQQPLSAELLSQQQLMIKQLQQHQQQSGVTVNSPKRIDLSVNNNRQQLLTQTIIHQTYGVQPQPPLQQSHILAQYQNQQQQATHATNLQLRQLSGSSVIPSTYSPPVPGAVPNRNMACLQMSYYSQSNNTLPHFGDPHPSQVPQQMQPEPRFPPTISVQRLAPQVQRQLRETQELIKDSCSQLYGGYPANVSPSPSTPTTAIRSQQPRTAIRRPSALDTQYSQELS